MRDVSIVIVSFNNFNYTLECLESLNQQTFKDFEIIIVDNSTQISSYLKLKKEIKKYQNSLEIRLYRPKSNLYFTGGNNFGIRKSSGNYICLLNYDTEVKEDFIEKCFEFLENNSSVGIICPKILIYHNKKYIWYAGAKIKPISSYFSEHIGLLEKEDKKFDKITETDYATGAALFIKREVLEEVGLLDEIYFMFSEDVDLSLRAIKKGYKLYYFPETIVYHKVSIKYSDYHLGPREKFYLIYLSLRNRQIIIWKHFHIIAILGFYLIFFLRKNILEFLINLKFRKIKLIQAQIRAVFMGFLIGIKRRTNRKCKKEIIKEYYYLQKHRM